jgi:small-conductance mechanosensitive channel
MLSAPEQILTAALAHLETAAATYIPSVAAAAVVILGAVVIAGVARRLTARFTEVTALERLFIQNGMLPRMPRLIPAVAYWAVLAGGCLAALSMFDPGLASRVVEICLALLPKLILAAAVVVAGMWSGQHFGSRALVWACNNDVPHGRTLASAVRVVIGFAALAMAADFLGFAPAVFLVAFILVGGAAALAFGIGVGGAIRSRLERTMERSGERQSASVWHHL